MPKHNDLIHLAEQQHGLVTRRQARQLGIDQRQVSRLGATSGWYQLTGEVLCRSGSAPTPARTIMAAVLDAGPDAFLSHLAAAHHWGARGSPARPVHVVRTRRGGRRTELAVVHVVRVLPLRWTTVLDSIPIVRPELLALQLFAICHEQRAERLVEALWSDRLLSGQSIARFLHELGRRGRDGTAGLRRYLAERGPDYTPAASGIEVRAVQILRNAGFTFRRQVDSGGSAWTGRVDLRDVEVPLIVEVQSERHHTALVDRCADTERIARLESAGFVVVEITDVEVWTQPGTVVERVRIAWNRAARSVPRPTTDL